MYKIYFLFLSIFCFQGCATLLGENQEQKAQIEKELKPVVQASQGEEKSQGENAEKGKAAAVTEDSEPMMRYSTLNNMAPPSDRNYRRMTRQRMEEESDLGSTAGSLWKMEGQTSYLFVENKHRREGDATIIKMEGSALKQIENKAAVINDLLGQLDEQRRVAEERERKAAEEKRRLAQIEAEKKLRAERIAKGEIVVDPMDEGTEAEAEVPRAPSSIADKAKAQKEDKIDLKEVEAVPSKIVEKMSDDTYRIRGQQYLTIRKKQYKLIATALVRAEDFNDKEISSNKLLEAEYDLVHVKRTAHE